jgi:hypothetical protein
VAFVTGGVVLLFSVGFSTLVARVAIGRLLWAAGIDKRRPRLTKSS